MATYTQRINAVNQNVIDGKAELDAAFQEIGITQSTPNETFEQYAEWISNLIPSGFSIQERWIDTGLAEWTDSSETAVRFIVPIINQYNSPSVLDGNRLTSCYQMYRQQAVQKVGYIDTSNVTDFEEMFYFSRLNEFVGDWVLDTSSAIDKGQNTFRHLFGSSPISDANKCKWNNPNGYDMAYCYYLSTVVTAPSPEWFQPIGNCTSMFQGNSSLRSVPAYDWSKVTVHNSMFFGCSALEKVEGIVDTVNTDIQNLSYGSNNNMFYGCVSLTSLKIITDLGFNFMFTKLDQESIDFLFDNLKQAKIYPINARFTFPQEYESIITQEQIDKAVSLGYTVSFDTP